jgi:divalent metal cation (Fe/Co/Zn/Cd) transporter
VLLGVGGVALGWDWADPVVGLVITAAILTVLYQAAREVYRRLMDAVDPALGPVRLRWVGHQLWAECEITVSGDITAVEAHEVAVNAEHGLLHALPRLSAALVHADPQSRQGTDLHAVLAPHR